MKKKRKSSAMKELEKMIPVVMGAGVTIMIYKQWLKDNVLLVINKRLENLKKRRKKLKVYDKSSWERNELKLEYTKQRYLELLALRRQLKKEFNLFAFQKGRGYGKNKKRRAD